MVKKIETPVYEAKDKSLFKSLDAAVTHDIRELFTDLLDNERFDDGPTFVIHTLAENWMRIRVELNEAWDAKHDDKDDFQKLIARGKPDG